LESAGANGVSRVVRSKVVIMGWYGNGNVGDEMILQCMLEDLRKVLPNASFTVISDDPADTSRSHGVRSLARGGTTVQRVRRAVAIMQSDLFILGGGSLLKRHGASDSSVLTWLGPLHLAHRMGVRAMTYAIGVSGEWSPSGRELVSRMLGEADAVCVRDQASNEILKGLGFGKGIVTADPAILLGDALPDGVRTPVLGGHPRISVFLRHWYVYENRILDEPAWKRFEQGLAASLDFLVRERSAHIAFVPMRTKTGDDDRIVAQEVAQMMSSKADAETVNGPVTTADVVRIIGESDLVIGMRLHSLIVAALSGVASIAIDYDEKVRGFENDLGAGDWVVEMDQGEKQIVNLAERALAGSYPVKMVENRVADMKVLARDNAKTAARLLKESGTPGLSVVKAFRNVGIFLDWILGGHSSS